MALIKCPECGNQISDRAKSCPNCGCPIEHLQAQSKKCPECGEIVSEHDIKCTNCGYPLMHKEVKSDVNEKKTPPEKHKPKTYQQRTQNYNSLLATCIAILVVLLLGFWLWGQCGSSDSPADIFEQVTTPEKDAEMCKNALKNSYTLQQLDFAQSNIYKKVKAYEQALYTGKIKKEQCDEFARHLGYVNAQIEERRALILYGNLSDDQ